MNMAELTIFENYYVKQLGKLSASSWLKKLCAVLFDKTMHSRSGFYGKFLLAAVIARRFTFCKSIEGNAAIIELLDYFDIYFFKFSIDSTP